MTIIRPELTWIDGAFRDGVEVQLEGDRIAAVAPTSEEPTHDGMALLPGFVNAHSHAFQLALRGRGETFPSDVGSFWTWREAMYELVESLDPNDVAEIAWRCFMEMRGVGITSVGEFHYFHHSDGARDFAMTVSWRPNFVAPPILLHLHCSLGDTRRCANLHQDIFHIHS